MARPAIHLFAKDPGLLQVLGREPRMGGPHDHHVGNAEGDGGVAGPRIGGHHEGGLPNEGLQGSQPDQVVPRGGKEDARPGLPGDLPGQFLFSRRRAAQDHPPHPQSIEKTPPGGGHGLGGPEFARAESGPGIEQKERFPRLDSQGPKDSPRLFLLPGENGQARPGVGNLHSHQPGQVGVEIPHVAGDPPRFLSHFPRLGALPESPGQEEGSPLQRSEPDRDPGQPGDQGRFLGAGKEEGCLETTPSQIPDFIEKSPGGPGPPRRHQDFPRLETGEQRKEVGTQGDGEIRGEPGGQGLKDGRGHDHVSHPVGPADYQGPRGEREEKTLPSGRTAPFPALRGGAGGYRIGFLCRQAVSTHSTGKAQMVSNIVLDRLCDEFDNDREKIGALLELLLAGASPLFIARYRKEATGSMSLSRILEIERRFRFLDLLERRKKRFFDALEKKGVSLDPEQAKAIKETFDPALLDDLFRPYGVLPAKGKRGGRREKREKRAFTRVAPLVAKIESGDLGSQTLVEAASELVDAQGGLPDAAAVLEEAAQALVQKVTEDREIRAKARDRLRHGVLHAKAVETRKKGGERYQNMAGLREPISRIPPANLLSLMAGAREGFLKLEILVDQVPLLDHLEKAHFPFLSRTGGELKRFLQDVLRRALTQWILPECQETVLEELRERCARDGLKPLQAKLRSLLMAPPFPGQTVMAVEPGPPSRGNRMVVASPDGSFLDDGLFRLDTPEKMEESKVKVKEFLEKWGVTFIALAPSRGDSGGVKSFLREVLAGMEKKIPLELVNDAGARSWAAGPGAKQELPHVEQPVRAVLSLARRVLDPISEYLKIDPMVLVGSARGMDLPPKLVRSALDEVVESCVALVGPDVNYAPQEVLAKVPGLDSRLSRDIDKRRASSPFKNLEELREVESIGERVFRNCAGFLRLHGGDNPLDVTQVHPERYELVGRMAQKAQVSVADLLGNKEKLESLPLEEFAGGDVGMPTLQDIVEQLLAHGVDPRGVFEPLELPEGIKELGDLQVGMKLKGRVTRVTDFGVFVDVGVEPEGLVHESRIPLPEGGGSPLADFVLGTLVEVRVVHVDTSQKRLALSMLPEGAAPPRRRNQGRHGGRERAGEEERRRSRRPRGGERRGSRDQDDRGGRGRPREGGRRPRRFDRGAEERVFRPKGVPALEAPLVNEFGELTSLSSLKALLGKEEKAPAAGGPSSPAGEKGPEGSGSGDPGETRPEPPGEAAPAGEGEKTRDAEAELSSPPPAEESREGEESVPPPVAEPAEEALPGPQAPPSPGTPSPEGDSPPEAVEPEKPE